MMLMRQLIGVGTPRGLQGRACALFDALLLALHRFRNHVSRSAAYMPENGQTHCRIASRHRFIHICCQSCKKAVLPQPARDPPRDHRRDPPEAVRWVDGATACNLTDSVEGCLRTASHRIHDRDPHYMRVFGEILAGGGVQPIRLPQKSPHLNAYADRFVRSIKEEYLSRVAPLGKAPVRQLVHEFVEPYHHERNHQGRDNQLLQRPPPPVNPDADVARRERLGGLLSFYDRAADYLHLTR